VRTLVLGGIRSGKSNWAELAIAEAVGPREPVRYLATGPAADDEPSWSRRVAEHRSRRPQNWSTVESVDIATQLRQSTDTATLVDDIGGWLTVALDRRDAWTTGSIAGDVDELIAAISVFGSTLFMVSPEVGLTVVPETESGRRFADELGTLNQRLAELCDRVVLVVAGQPLALKKFSTTESDF
jgi:adenosylcobinamide kinase/adenosylcobinamide-phosphate guanylyltransferase